MLIERKRVVIRKLKIMILIILVLVLSGCTDCFESKPAIRFTIHNEKGVLPTVDYKGKLVGCSYWENGSFLLTYNITNCEQAIEKYGIRG